MSVDDMCGCDPKAKSHGPKCIWSDQNPVICARAGCEQKRDQFCHDRRSRYYHAFVEPSPPPPTENARAGAIDVAAYNERTWRDVQSRTIAQKHRPASMGGFTYGAAIVALEKAVDEALTIGLAAGRARGIEEGKKQRDGLLPWVTEVGAERTSLKSKLLELGAIDVAWIKNEGLLCCPVCDFAHHEDDYAGTKVHEDDCVFQAIADAIAKED